MLAFIFVEYILLPCGIKVAPVGILRAAKHMKALTSKVVHRSTLALSE